MQPKRAGYSSKTAAARLGIQPASMSTAVWRNGSYCGVRPTKLPNGRWLWDADEIERLAAGEFEVTAPSSAERLAAGRDRARKARDLASEDRKANAPETVAGQYRCSPPGADTPAEEV